MIKLNKPVNLNGTELRQELNAGGVKISDELSSIKDDGDGNLWLDIADKDEVKAKSIVAVHNGNVIAPDNSTAKSALLVKLGITEDEAKLLLA